MSALGHERTYALQQAMSALPPIATAKADMPRAAILRTVEKPGSGTYARNDNRQKFSATKKAALPQGATLVFVGTINFDFGALVASYRLPVLAIPSLLWRALWWPY
jgi:hypothetical protein